MASPAQNLANIANAKLSTGPKTESGKRSSQFNALRHGLTACTVVLPHENRQAYQNFAAQLLATFAPVGMLEQQLAQTVVDTYWRLNRVPVLESNLFALAQLQPPPEHLAGIADPLVRAALLEAHSLSSHQRELRNLHLQEQRLYRTLHVAMEQLVALQNHRRAEQRNTLAATLPAPTAPPVGFDFAGPVSSASAPVHPTAFHPLTTAHPSRISKNAAAA